MTQVALRPDPTLRRRGVIYGIRTLDPDSGTVVLGYVGQTFQRLRRREAQHREDQPWSDLIVGAAFVIAEGWWTCADIDQVEAARIGVLRPVYNYDHNLTNPGRVPVWLARQQRAQRDAAAGRPAWVPSQRRPAASRLGGRWRRARLWWRGLPRWARRLAWRAGVWLVLTAVLWLMSSSLVGALVVATVAVGAAGRRRRRVRRR